ncbi:hypothetical protein PIB30_085874 [Stylosanthes scabra]|uniref:Uncharacterized protein n=1 Tax=Stylosanthes scabra TaxID=79078 RepID=A0ABU6XVJ4_9FABA|nr:hypothetical protein [Stylosanthes scabra]
MAISTTSTDLKIQISSISDRLNEVNFFTIRGAKLQHHIVAEKIPPLYDSDTAKTSSMGDRSLTGITHIIVDEVHESPDLPLARYCPLCEFHAPPHRFAFDKSRDDSQSPPRPLVKTRLTRERYPHPYKECFVPSPTDAGLTFHPPRGAQRPRWRTDPGSGSDIICNSPDFSLQDIVHFVGFMHHLTVLPLTRAEMIAKAPTSTCQNPSY